MCEHYCVKRMRELKNGCEFRTILRTSERALKLIYIMTKMRRFRVRLAGLMNMNFFVRD